jgi:hypothetical protein
MPLSLDMEITVAQGSTWQRDILCQKPTDHLHISSATTRTNWSCSMHIALSTLQAWRGPREQSHLRMTDRDDRGVDWHQQATFTSDLHRHQLLNVANAPLRYCAVAHSHRSGANSTCGSLPKDILGFRLRLLLRLCATKFCFHSESASKLLDTRENHLSLSPRDLSVQSTMALWLDRIRTSHVTHDTHIRYEYARPHALTDKKHDCCQFPTINLKCSIM